VTTMLKMNVNTTWLLFIFGILMVAHVSEAASSSTTQTITITIPAIRAIYLDHQDRIIGVFSNVPVIDEQKLQAFKSGVQTVVTEETLEQYRELKPHLDWSKIGWIYLQTNPDTKTEDQQKTKQSISEEKLKAQETVFEEILRQITIWSDCVYV
jgi:hypothetical protein